MVEELVELPFFEQPGIFSVRQRRRMLDTEYIEGLLTIVIEGVQDKKDYLDNVCENIWIAKKIRNLFRLYRRYKF